jgi:hypothetical protein
MGKLLTAAPPYVEKKSSIFDVLDFSAVRAKYTLQSFTTSLLSPLDSVESTHVSMYGQGEAPSERSSNVEHE